ARWPATRKSATSCGNRTATNAIRLFRRSSFSATLRRTALPGRWRMSRFWKWMIAVVVFLPVAAFAVLSFMAGSPRDAYGMVRYALPHMHRGTLKPGDDAPDARLVTLDGANRFH